MNREDNVPITTPRIIANAKLRIESPPRMKIHSSTINVLNEVFIVRARVVFNESEGVTNIVCTQPFGCLPNHIAGKGMIRKIREVYPQANIVAVDYDPGASKINQENRIKLMLSSAE